jgi:hypothetical protein
MMTDDVPSICLKRRSAPLRWLFGERDHLDDICEETDGYCAYCHSRIAARQNEDDYHHGPAPLGFEKDDGRLIESENYHDVVAVLDMMQKDELSKRKAAERLDCARSTIGRAIDRAELYGI